MNAMENTCARLQKRIDELSRRMQLDANDLDYETHLRQKRELQSMLNHLTRAGKERLHSDTYK